MPSLQPWRTPERADGDCPLSLKPPFPCSVFLAEEEPSMAPGKLGMNAIQRRVLRASGDGLPGTACLPTPSSLSPRTRVH